MIINSTFTIALGSLVLLAGILFLLPGCAANGKAMRLHSKPGSLHPQGLSAYIEGKNSDGVPISCSFVEFDERGDFLDFQQHRDCEERIRTMVDSGQRVLVMIYCHGWKNNSQSGDVIEFNAFLGQLAASKEIRAKGLRVHGVYLGWRGNSFKPYVDQGKSNLNLLTTQQFYGAEPIVAAQYQRRFAMTGTIPETLSYWNRKAAAESKVCGLPIARAAFTYAAAAKGFGKAPSNRVVVLGHSFGALMLERSLGQAMTGALTMMWQDKSVQGMQAPAMPFDLVLLVNSAAPSIYAKEMRDFLMAYRRGLERSGNPTSDAPVIISVTSTADWATGKVHPIGNLLAPLDPSLQRKYTNGVLVDPGQAGFPDHDPIRQSAFYNKTPGHQPLLINHWIVKQPGANLPSDTSHDAVMSANLAANVTDHDRFFTSAGHLPAAVWRLEIESPSTPYSIGGKVPAMKDSDYWVINCDKEIISGHNDIWNPAAMEMYAGLFRAAQSRTNR